MLLFKLIWTEEIVTTNPQPDAARVTPDKLLTFMIIYLGINTKPKTNTNQKPKQANENKGNEP